MLSSKHEKVIVLVLNVGTMKKINSNPVYKVILENYKKKQLRKNPHLGPEDVTIIPCSPEDFTDARRPALGPLFTCTKHSKIIIVALHRPGSSFLRSEPLGFGMVLSKKDPRNLNFSAWHNSAFIFTPDGMFYFDCDSREVRKVDITPDVLTALKKRLGITDSSYNFTDDTITKCPSESQIDDIEMAVSGILTIKRENKFELDTMCSALATRLESCRDSDTYGSHDQMIKIFIGACFTANQDSSREDHKSFAQQFHDKMTSQGIICEVVGQIGLYAPLPVSKRTGGLLAYAAGSRQEDFSSRRFPVSTAFFDPRPEKSKGFFSYNPYTMTSNVLSAAWTACQYSLFSQSNFKRKIRTTNATPTDIASHESVARMANPDPADSMW